MSLDKGYMKTQEAMALAKPYDIVSTMNESAESLEETWALATSRFRRQKDNDKEEEEGLYCPPIESILQKLEIYWYAKANSVDYDNRRTEEALRIYLGDDIVDRLISGSKS